ncbi:helix-turn-helix domain-containing protein [Brachybacterium subflavum]|uniref:helix-turn-helix domain-containing protein n=1 Tax=Brachybacterium subflavum TaxID=2585206 RepID=UPI0012660DCA|nr:helix-turn-helix domain-containing protein [Brachybacterium subflavum]
MTSSDGLPRFVSLEHVQSELSISYQQALALVRSGELRAIKVGGRGQWRVSLGALEDYIADRYAETAAMVSSRDGHELPAPDCESGYPIEQLVRELGEEHLGELQEYVMMRASVNCPEHGIVLYAVDAERYVEQRASRPK